MNTERPHLLLVNLGTPTAPTDVAVREFLAEFLADPAVVDLPRFLWRPILNGMILRSRPARVAHQYRSIWTDAGSPLRVATDLIVKDIRALAGDAFTVSAAYRYGEPSLDTAMRELAGQGSGQIVVSPLFPQRTDATTGTAFKKAREAAARAGIADRIVERLVAPNAPSYIEALAARWQSAIAGGELPDHLVISFHGIPVRYNRRERRSYTMDCEATTRALLAAIDWPAERATLAYQSKFGPEPWLTPATADVLAQLPARGVSRVAVITPGFVTEGLETLEEIGIRGLETFVEAGGKSLLRIGAAENHPAFLAALMALTQP